MSSATNILDRWIAAATRRLTAFVRVEMDAYRLYTVVPQLVAFIESLTNVYVRYNRTRLKGRLGAQDCQFALASLFDVLLTVCKVRSQSPLPGRRLSRQAQAISTNTHQQGLENRLRMLVNQRRSGKLEVCACCVTEGACVCVWRVSCEFAQVMAPFTPFFCESLYQNLRQALPEDAPQSVHWCDFPSAAAEQVRRPDCSEVSKHCRAYP